MLDFASGACEGEVPGEDLGRTPLPHDVAAGQEILIDIAVSGDLASGHSELRYDIVAEGVTWFEFQGSPCVRRYLTVVA